MINNNNMPQPTRGGNGNTMHRNLVLLIIIFASKSIFAFIAAPGRGKVALSISENSLDSLVSSIIDDDNDDLEKQSIKLLAELIRPLPSSSSSFDDGMENEYEFGHNRNLEKENQLAYELAKGRFVNLCSQREGETKLESLFLKSAETKAGMTIICNDDLHDSNLVQYQKVVETSIKALQSGKTIRLVWFVNFSFSCL